MAKKPHVLLFTIIFTSLIIEPISTKHVKKANKPEKKNMRINLLQSADEGMNFSNGSDDQGHGYTSQYENNPKKDDDFNMYTSDLLQLGGTTYGPSHPKTTMHPSEIMGFSLTNAEMEKFRIWPDGVIPYYIDVNSFSDKILRDKIRSFLNSVNSLTSLNFIEYPSPPEDDDTRWVFFINRRGLLGCADHSVWNFTTKGVQRVVLGYDCMNKEGELPEAVLAIAGVPAQHTAPDRDQYITVNIDNVISDKRKLFDKLPDGDWLFHDLPYDYNSAGHYHNFKYSENGHTVIEPLDQSITIGETRVLSDIDIQKIKLLYDYITKKKRLDAPECDKLFKVGKGIKDYKPENIIQKPNRKPSQYQSEALPSVDYFDTELIEKPAKLTEWHKESNEKLIKMPVIVKPMDKPDGKVKPPKSIVKDAPSDSFDNKKDINQLKAKVSKVYDPLELSDDTSDDNYYKFNKIKQGKFETLKAGSDAFKN